LETRKYTPGDSDITVDLNSGIFSAEDGPELAERLRAETDLRVESGLFDYYSEGDPFPPEVILAILYTLFPLKESYANVLSEVLLGKARAARARMRARIPGMRSGVVFLVRKVDQDGRKIRDVRGYTNDPEIIKELIRLAGEEGPDDVSNLPIH
jgi:hypothetical protein